MDFISKAELELYISKKVTIFTRDIISEFKNAEMVRRVATKIWYREGTFRVGILLNIMIKKLSSTAKNF